MRNLQEKIQIDWRLAHSSLSSGKSPRGAWKGCLWPLARVKIRFLICSDRISGSGGSMPTGFLGNVAEERGEGCPTEDIERWRVLGLIFGRSPVSPRLGLSVSDRGRGTFNGICLCTGGHDKSSDASISDSMVD